MISPRPLSATVTGRATGYEQLLADGPQDLRVNRQFRRLVDNIVREFPLQQGGTLLLTGVSSSGHIADVAAHVARQLALQPDVNVLLVDADPDAMVLSQRLASDHHAGLVEILQQEIPLAVAAQATIVPNLRFLPFGQSPCPRTTMTSQRVRTTLQELKQHSRYVVLATGGEANLLPALLGRHCDGTYLVVQLTAADRQQTAELASHLTASGARLLGCVATSVG